MAADPDAPLVEDVDDDAPLVEDVDADAPVVEDVEDDAPVVEDVEDAAPGRRRRGGEKEPEGPPPTHVRKTTNNCSGWEKPYGKQEVLCTFVAWPRPGDAPPLSEDLLNIEKWSLEGGEPAAARRYQTLQVRSPPPPEPPGFGDDDLDEWLQLPNPVRLTKAKWALALDDCLGGTRNGENRRLGHVSDETKGLHGKQGSDGDVVRGTIKLVSGWSGACKPKRDWFGLSVDAGEEPDDAPSKDVAAPFVVCLGDGRTSEGFEACLKAVKKNLVSRFTISGECLLPDTVLTRSSSTRVPRAGGPTPKRATARASTAHRQGRRGAARHLDVAVTEVDDTRKKLRDPMTMDMRTKEKVALELKERGTRLFAAKRYRRAELVWHDGVRLFGFLKPEDTGMDPQDFHMNENNRGRQASIPLLLNEAMLMRKRGAFADCETNLNECIENDGNHVKSLFRRGQVRIDLKKSDKGLFSDQRAPVSKKSSQSHKNYDWTASYDTTRPKIYSDQDAPRPEPDNKPVIVRDLEGELDEISDEEYEAQREAKQAYYNQQIGLGNMRVQLPPPGAKKPDDAKAKPRQ
ncbi:FK506 binding protein [Aureococcus anophagefferens]|nr:FK506 binding protein [Aureococcus anophagefferens]